ncbi:hypothetical protein EV361DRAFT_941506 [Lentinula raphanica]|uniref:Uncharacterized protein n=1 Tax=Lentinula raphanica TaxID=153919 RepID=A0AA38NX11_9AGAR|nr:hypothetical protein F5878DRAFT_635571 [Lentinula raphanica]KAJ3964707.1 hypothetical protein EV361DRAFT_941506 [Lentinula raphanica]
MSHSEIQSIQDAFLFSAPADILGIPSTARKVHIRRLYEVLQLCIHRNDLPRARRAWSVLLRCKEINWITMWGVAIHLVEETSYGSTRKIELLRDMMLHYPDQRVNVIKELIFRLILSGRHREALDELELYLPSFPYQDNPVLHVYAGLFCFYLAQENAYDTGTALQTSLVREATTHFERARVLEPGNIIAVAFLHKIAVRSLESNIQATQLEDSDDEPMIQDPIHPKSKRLRQTMSSP